VVLVLNFVMSSVIGGHVIIIIRNQNNAIIGMTIVTASLMEWSILVAQFLKLELANVELEQVHAQQEFGQIVQEL